MEIKPIASTFPRHAAAPADSSSRRENPAPAHSYETIVIGAGPTGLCASYFLERNTLLIERRSSVGGRGRSIRDGDFIFDCATDVFEPSDAYVHELIGRLLGDNIHRRQPRAAVYDRGNYEDCTFAIASAYGRAPSFEHFIDERYTDENIRRTAIAYHRKLLTVPLSEIETSWLGAGTNNTNTAAGAVAWPANGTEFFYPLRGGSQALMESFLPHIRADIELQTEVIGIAPTRRIVTLANGKQFRYRNLISTMPLPELIRTMGDHAPAAVRDAARRLRYVSLRRVNMGFARSDITDRNWIYYPEHALFHRVIAQTNASPHCSPGGMSALTFEISYSPSRPLLAHGEDLIEHCIDDSVRSELLRAGDRPIVANEVDIPYGYVLHDQTRAHNVAVIRNWLDQYDIFLAGRYGEWEQSATGHPFIAGKKVAQVVKENSYRSHLVGI